MQKRIISAVLFAVMFATSAFSVPLAGAVIDENYSLTGDIDINGSIDVTDLTELSLALVGDRNLTADQQKAADIDGDGDITLADLAKLRQYLSKKISRREFENNTLVSIVDTKSMIATVKEVKDDVLFLIPAENLKEIGSPDLLIVRYDNAEQLFKAGDTVRVEYDGSIQESNPPQIRPYTISIY